MIPLILAQYLAVYPIRCGDYDRFLEETRAQNGRKVIEMTVDNYRLEKWETKDRKAVVLVKGGVVCIVQPATDK